MNFRDKNVQALLRKTNDGYECTECQQKIVSKVNAAKHARNVHLKPKTFSCELGCEKKFKTQAGLANHYLQNHEFDSANCPHPNCGHSGNNIKRYITLIFWPFNFKF